MIRLAYRQLTLDPARTMMTALAVGATVAVILVLSGFEQGQYYQLEQAVLNRDADLILTQAGVGNLIAVRSSVPQLTREKVERVDGVVNAHPITAFPVIYSSNGIRSPIYVFVVDQKGGPRTIVDGENVDQGRTIVIDRSLAEKHDLEVGDPLIISDFELTVSGIAEGAAAFFTPFAFISYDGMIDLFLESELAPDISTFPLLSFMLVEVDPEHDVTAIGDEIEANVEEVDVFLPEELAARDVGLGKSLLGPIFSLLVGIAYIIGLLVIALVTYVEINGRLLGFGVMKALGFSNRQLAASVLFQVTLLLAVAVPLGTTMAYGIAGFIESAAPVYLVRVLDLSVVVRMVAASVIFSWTGALLSVRVIRRADPMMAFQGG